MRPLRGADLVAGWLLPAEQARLRSSADRQHAGPGALAGASWLRRRTWSVLPGPFGVIGAYPVLLASPSWRSRWRTGRTPAPSGRCWPPWPWRASARPSTSRRGAGATIGILVTVAALLDTRRAPRDVLPPAAGRAAAVLGGGDGRRRSLARRRRRCPTPSSLLPSRRAARRCLAAAAERRRRSRRRRSARRRPRPGRGRRDPGGPGCPGRWASPASACSTASVPARRCRLLGRLRQRRSGARQDGSRDG